MKGIRDGNIIVEANREEIPGVAGLRAAIDARAKAGAGSVVMLRIVPSGEMLRYRSLPR